MSCWNCNQWEGTLLKKNQNNQVNLWSAFLNVISSFVNFKFWQKKIFSTSVHIGMSIQQLILLWLLFCFKFSRLRRKGLVSGNWVSKNHLPAHIYGYVWECQNRYIHFFKKTHAYNSKKKINLKKKREKQKKPKKAQYRACQWKSCYAISNNERENTYGTLRAFSFMLDQVSYFNFLEVKFTKTSMLHTR